MPKYSFKCKDCDSEFSTIINYSEIKNTSCEKCGSKRLTRIFGFVGQKIQRSSSEIMSNIKEEAKIIADKVRSGDQNAIGEIYGDQK